MSRFDAPVMLVGSVPLSSAEEVLAVAADEIGDLVAALPDGETRYRTTWVIYQAYFVHHRHRDIETLLRPEPVDGIPQWSSTSFDNLWSFRVKDDVGSVEYGELFYADEAIRSYTAFADLRDEGRIPKGVRFQVSLPTPPGAIMSFFRDRGSDYYKVRAGYERAMVREVEKIAAAIPPADLAIQWDVCSEVIDNEGAFPWLPDADKAWDRYVETIRGIGAAVPEEALVGYHLCYGDIGHKHIVDPKDLGLLTRMANTAVAESGRTVDWMHMPVPIDRDDDEYFAPLADLQTPDSRLFLGLIHAHDGVEGARRRLDVARRHVDAPIGVSTECGFGRRPPETIPGLLGLHRAVAEELLSASSASSIRPFSRKAWS